MLILEIKKVWKLVNEIKKTIYEFPDHLKENIVSIVLYGSLIRNDFKFGISDIDIFIIFKDDALNMHIKEIIKKIKSLEKYYNEGRFKDMIDIAWAYYGELPLKGSGRQGFFKFLNIYAFDFVKNSIVIYGYDFRDQLEVKDPKNLIVSRAKDILMKLEQAKNRNLDLIPILAGETIRLAQLCFGEITINKNVVLDNFLKYVPDYPMKKTAQLIWFEYMNPGFYEKLSDIEKRDFIKICEKFIRETIKLILNHTR